MIALALSLAVVAAAPLEAAAGDAATPSDSAVNPAPAASAPQPPAPPAPQPPAIPAPQPSATPAQQPPASPGAPLLLASAADARRLCEAVTPEGRGAVGDGIVERAEAEALQGEAWEAAMAGHYRAVIPGERLRFAAWSPDTGLLEVARTGLPSAADGSVRLALVEDPALPVHADAAAVRRILAARAEKKLTLRVTFVLSEAEADAPCFHVPGAQAWTLSAEPIAWEYAAGDEVLARGGEGSDRPVVSAKDGARPRVQVGEPSDGEGKALRGAVLGRVGDIEGCYATALGKDPFVDGAIVADLAPRGGQEGVRIAADSTNDPGLVDCVRGVLASLDLRGAGRTFLPIHFVLEGPGAAEGGRP